jgi:flagellar basal body L-ring protein FlgH
VCQILFLLNYDKRIIKIYKSINRRGISSNNLLKLVEITQIAEAKLSWQWENHWVPLKPKVKG